MSRHVTGIGGIFFRANDHKAMAKWYYEHFGINDPDHGWTMAARYRGWCWAVAGFCKRKL